MAGAVISGRVLGTGTSARRRRLRCGPMSLASLLAHADSAARTRKPTAGAGPHTDINNDDFCSCKTLEDAHVATASIVLAIEMSSSILYIYTHTAVM